MGVYVSPSEGRPKVKEGSNLRPNLRGVIFTNQAVSYSQTNFQSTFLQID